MAALLWFIKSSRIGRAMRATEQNPDVAGLMGVDTNRIIAFTFLLGSAVGALAGVMVVLYYGLGHYFMGFMLGLKAFTAAVLGGIGNVAGAMLGGLLLGVIESLASGYIGDLTGGRPRQQLPRRLRVPRADRGARAASPRGSWAGT